MKKTKTATPLTPGVIRPGDVYTLPEAGTRARMGKAAFREARRQGLKVHYHGRNAYVFGSDLIAYLKRNASLERPGLVGKTGDNIEASASNEKPGSESSSVDEANASIETLGSVAESAKSDVSRPAMLRSRQED